MQYCIACRTADRQKDAGADAAWDIPTKFNNITSITLIRNSGPYQWWPSSLTSLSTIDCESVTLATLPITYTRVSFINTIIEHDHGDDEANRKYPLLVNMTHLTYEPYAYELSLIDLIGGHHTSTCSQQSLVDVTLVISPIENAPHLERLFHWLATSAPQLQRLTIIFRDTGLSPVASTAGQHDHHNLMHH